MHARGVKIMRMADLNAGRHSCSCREVYWSWKNYVLVCSYSFVFICVICL